MTFVSDQPLAIDGIALQARAPKQLRSKKSPKKGEN